MAKEWPVWKQCDYKDCEKEMVSNGNSVFDTEGEQYEVALCKFHLNKLIGGKIKIIKAVARVE